MRLKHTIPAAVMIVAVGAAAGVAERDDAADYPYLPYDHPAIQYPNSAPDDAISRLQTKMDRGEVKLDFDAKWGYLPSLLKRLGVNVDSQMLVFSKTSFQGPRNLAPKNLARSISTTMSP